MVKQHKVKFKIPAQKLSYFSKEYRQYAALCREVFGIELPEAKWKHTEATPDVTITCWSSQFAEFLILRHHLKMQNQFQFLEAVLLPCEKPPREKNYVFDVTRE